MACAQTNTQNNTNIRRTPKRNRRPEKKTIFVFFVFSFSFLFIYNFLNYFSKKCWVTALVRSMTFIRGFIKHTKQSILWLQYIKFLKYAVPLKTKKLLSSFKKSYFELNSNDPLNYSVIYFLLLPAPLWR